MKCLVILALFIFCGCEQVPESYNQKEIRLQQYVLSHLPNGAKNINDIGNDWYTFELEINGKNQSFLFRRTGSGNSITECITKVSD